MVNRCVMPIFYLAPREGQSNDPRWAATSLREGCWVAARSGYAARLKVGMATLKEECWIVAPRRRMSRDQEKRYSPWLNAPLTECRPANPPIDVPEGIIVTVSGKPISVGVPVGGRLLAQGSAGSIKPAGAHRCANSEPTARPCLQQHPALDSSIARAAPRVAPHLGIIAQISDLAHRSMMPSPGGWSMYSMPMLRRSPSLTRTGRTLLRVAGGSAPG